MGVFNIRGMELNQAKFGDWMKKTFDLAKKCSRQRLGFSGTDWWKNVLNNHRKGFSSKKPAGMCPGKSNSII